MLILRPDSNPRHRLCSAAPHSVRVLEEANEQKQKQQEEEEAFATGSDHHSEARRRPSEESKAEDTSDTSTSTQDMLNDGLQDSAQSPLRKTVKQKSLRFGQVRIRTHKITLGDNPSVSAGPPIALDWDHTASESYDVDFLEDLNEGRSPKKAARIPESQREAFLRAKGYTTACVAKALEEIHEIKATRKKSIETPSEVEEHMEMVHVRTTVERGPRRAGSMSFLNKEESSATCTTRRRAGGRFSLFSKWRSKSTSRIEI